MNTLFVCFCFYFVCCFALKKKYYEVLFGFFDPLFCLVLLYACRMVSSCIVIFVVCVHYYIHNEKNKNKKKTWTGHVNAYARKAAHARTCVLLKKIRGWKVSRTAKITNLAPRGNNPIRYTLHIPIQRQHAHKNCNIRLYARLL